MNEMIQEAVLDCIDSIDEQQLVAEYEVLVALAETHIKSAMIQEANSSLSFDGYSVFQEADENANKYNAGELTNAKSGIPVKNFTQLHDVEDKKWYQKLWDWILKMARLLRTKWQRFCSKIKSAWTKFRTLTDADANALRQVGCKIVAGQRGDYKFDVEFPFNIDFEELSKQLDELLKVLQNLEDVYEKASSGDGKLIGASMMNNRLAKISNAITKATKNTKKYYTATDFFDKQSDLADTLGKLEEPVSVLKKSYAKNAVNSETAAVAAKAAGVFNVLNTAVTNAMNDGLQLISDCEHAVKMKSDKAELKHDQRNLHKEQKALSQNHGLAEFPVS